MGNVDGSLWCLLASMVEVFEGELLGMAMTSVQCSAAVCIGETREDAISSCVRFDVKAGPVKSETECTNMSSRHKTLILPASPSKYHPHPNIRHHGPRTSAHRRTAIYIASSIDIIANVSTHLPRLDNCSVDMYFYQTMLPRRLQWENHQTCTWNNRFLTKSRGSWDPNRALLKLLYLWVALLYSFDTQRWVGFGSIDLLL